MPTVTLDTTYTYRGKFYGPGAVEVPDDFPLLQQGEDAQAPSSSAPQQGDEGQPKKGGRKKAAQAQSADEKQQGNA